MMIRWFFIYIISYLDMSLITLADSYKVENNKNVFDHSWFIPPALRSKRGDYVFASVHANVCYCCLSCA